MLIVIGVSAGDTITYIFTVTNTGNVALTGVTISDPDVLIAGGPIDLAVGESDSEEFTGVYTITQDDIDAGEFVNVATATGLDPDDNPVTDTSDDPTDPTNDDPDNDGEPDDPTVTDLTNPSLSLEKTGVYEDVNGNGVIDTEDVINYTFAVVNIQETLILQT